MGRTTLLPKGKKLSSNNGALTDEQICRVVEGMGGVNPSIGHDDRVDGIYICFQPRNGNLKSLRRWMRKYLLRRFAGEVNRVYIVPDARRGEQCDVLLLKSGAKKFVPSYLFITAKIMGSRA
jgi:hypothetical protein